MKSWSSPLPKNPRHRRMRRRDQFGDRRGFNCGPVPCGLKLFQSIVPRLSPRIHFRNDVFRDPVFVKGKAGRRKRQVVECDKNRRNETEVRNSPVARQDEGLALIRLSRRRVVEDESIAPVAPNDINKALRQVKAVGRDAVQNPDKPVFLPFIVNAAGGDFRLEGLR